MATLVHSSNIFKLLKPDARLQRLEHDFELPVTAEGSVWAHMPELFTITRESHSSQWGHQGGQDLQR
ncbi:hypothetical protein FOXG_22887 [Fusarium oxysporum f. sp. lycopersici 4287]|uniref:Uncharacterized protein n=1 Tax=Fusarium oxysporum f. sp. lycopersici (strain 4287 / CBS 123668 / FGSC 9935 / NRRL 34936) TaxID=426428 RepID=A0A0J9WD81_FUSO4|nr:uncharacterized protein FOXG_22887 [Fusarium oxysporum f. sp. lycopersici 4287]KNB20641.1 hypothetical protein FOXG_22887 [Fusarium oxysporum f. sp. lycopersici 4287]